jgi:uncharacterized membrane protein
MDNNDFYENNTNVTTHLHKLTKIQKLNFFFLLLLFYFIFIFFMTFHKKIFKFVIIYFQKKNIKKTDDIQIV